MVHEQEHVIYRCPSCGTSNRIPQARVGDDPTCGKCKGKLFPRRPVIVTDESFAREVEASPLPVLVDFWAPWCGPCRAMAPVLEAVARERAGQLKVAKLNVDENPTVASRFGIRSVPTLLLMQGAQPMAEMVGAVPKAMLDARLEEQLRGNRNAPHSN